MALPQQLKTARYTNSLQVSSIDNSFGELEQAIADILGLPVNTDITEVVTGRVKYAQVNDSNAVSNTVTETAFNKTYSIPANSLAVGNVIKIRAFGKYTSVANPSLDIRLRIGGTTVAVVGTGTAGSPTDAPWFLEFVGIIRSIGASGSLAGGEYDGRMQGGSSIVPSVTLSTTVDTTVGRTVDVTAQWGTASASNTVTMRGLIVEILPAGSTS